MSEDTQVPWEVGVRKDGDMNQKVMTRNLLDFKLIMNKHGIEFMLIFGTLLGAIREGGLIEYDTDADVACLETNHRMIHRVVTDLLGLGFKIVPRDYSPLHDMFFIRDGEKIEIWWFCDTGTEWLYDKSIRYPKSFFDTTEQVDFLGNTFKVPNNPKEFLTLTYGNDWVTPDRNKRYTIGK